LTFGALIVSCCRGLLDSVGRGFLYLEGFNDSPLPRVSRQTRAWGAPHLAPTFRREHCSRATLEIKRVQSIRNNLEKVMKSFIDVSSVPLDLRQWLSP